MNIQIKYTEATENCCQIWHGTAVVEYGEHAVVIEWSALPTRQGEPELQDNWVVAGVFPKDEPFSTEIPHKGRPWEVYLLGDLLRGNPITESLLRDKIHSSLAQHPTVK